MTGRRHLIWCHAMAALSLCGGVFWSAGGPAVAQMDKAPAAAEPRSVVVVREYLQEALVPARIRGHMPMTRDTFEARLRALRQATTTDVAEQARLVTGVYYAKYQRGQLVDGRAGLETVNKRQANSLLSLAPAILPIYQLRWSDQEMTNPSAGAGQDGKFVVFADRNGRLLFSWSLGGDQLPAGDEVQRLADGARFSLSLPPSSINQLVLDLPAGLVPVVDGGHVSELSDTFSDPAVVPRDVGDGLARWNVTLGGIHEFALRIMPQAAAADSTAFTRVRQATTYRLSTSAVDVQAEISLAFSQSELHQLVLKTDPDLQVARVRIGEGELLPDQITKGTDPGHVVLTFDRPLKGANRKLIVNAVSPMVLDQPLRLPTLTPLNLAWEQATATVEVPKSLVLNKLSCHDAVETSVQYRSADDGNDVHQVRFYSQAASCEVVVGRPSTRAVVASGSAIAVSPTTLTAQIVANVHAVDGEVYLLDALIAPAWQVDSVESDPADALDGTPSRRTRGGKIRMQLRRPVSGDKGVRIIIKARRNMPAVGTALSVEDFRIVEFANVAKHRRLVSLRAEAPYHLMVAGESQPQVNHADLTATDLELLGPLSGRRVYIDQGSPQASLRVSLTQEKPGFRGQISVEAMADSDVLRQAIRIQCQPESSPVSRLLIRFSPTPDVPFTWSTDEPDGIQSARLIKTNNSEATTVWEVQLRRPQTTPFSLTAVCSSPFTEPAPVYLATLVEAVDQNGTVAVGAVDGSTLLVDATGLAAVPVVDPDDSEYTYQQAAFRYDPRRTDAITVSRSATTQNSALAWAWSCALVSRFETNGVTSHQVRYKIENSGRPQTEITLTGEANVQRVLVDAIEVSYAKSSGDLQRLTIQLPPKKRFTMVDVEYSTEGDPLRDFAPQRVNWPQIDLNCLRRSWDIWLPPGLRASRDDRFVKTTSSSPPNWADRIFGKPLLRRDRPPFDLFALEDWQSIRRTSASDAANSASAFVTALTNLLAARETPDSAIADLTWGQIITRYEMLRRTESSATRLGKLRIDTSALLEQGVFPDTVFSIDRSQSVAAILSAHNAAVVAGPNSILLTSQARLGDFDDTLRATTNPGVFLSRRDEDGPAGTVSPQRWSSTASLAVDLWSQRDRPAKQEVAIGWRHYQLRPDAAPVVQFSVYRPAVRRVTGWGVAFVMIAAVVWFSKRRVWALILLVLAIVLTLLVPVQFLPVARGLMWGAVVGLFVAWLRSKTRQPNLVPSLPTESSVGLARATVILLVALGTWQTFADDDVPALAPDAMQIYRVVIPVDEEQKPAGGFVFVPNQLFHSLHRPVAAVQIAKMNWLLRAASYETSLAQRGDADDLLAAEVAADFELETLQLDTVVALPLGRASLREFSDVKLDGQVIEPAWNANGDAIEFPVARSGRHRLELKIRPVLRNDTQTSGFALQIPEFAGSRLKVSPSSRIAGIELPTTVGAIQRSEALGTIDADLGPTNVLAVRWPLNTKEVTESVPMTAVERFWLRIQPSTVVLEGQFSFSVPSGGIKQVELLVDPRLKLSQLVPSHPAKHEPASGTEPAIVVRFDDPNEKLVFIHATFLVTDTSGLGHIYLPRLSATADFKSNATLGLSVAPQLHVELVAEPPLQAILPAEFLADWKEATDAPQLAYRLAETTTSWHATSRPQVTFPDASQVSNWSVGRTRAGLHYAAEIDPVGQTCFQQRLQLPASVEVSKLEVLQAAAVQPVRFSRADGVLTVFFEQAIKAPYQLVISGQAPVAFRAATRLPLVSLLEVESKSNRMVVRQRSDVLIRSLRADGLVPHTADAPESILTDSREGRVVGSYRFPPEGTDPAAAGLSFMTRRNQPRIVGDIVNRVLIGDDDLWMADTRLALEVEKKSGTVDEIRLVLPAGWSQEVSLTPDIKHHVIGEGDERVLLVRPEKPFTGKFQLRLRCQMQRATVALPEVQFVELLNESRIKKFLVLPRRHRDELISWETTGLLEIQSLSAPTASLASDDSTTYRVEGKRATAVVRNVGQSGGTPQVQLADIHVVCNHDRTCYGVVAFDVMPLQLSQCTLVIPATCSVVHVAVAGVPVTARWKEENRLVIPLGPEQLPQRIEIVFMGQVGTTLSVPGQTIATPHLADLPVEQTLWTIYGPRDEKFVAALLAHTRCTRVQQARIRARSATRALEVAEALTPPVAEAGFESWQERWERRRDVANSYVADEAAILDLSAYTFVKSHTDRGDPERFQISGNSSSMNVHFAPSQASDLGQRLVVAVIIICLVGVLRLATQRFRLRQWVEQTWPTLGVGMGVVWWLWFTPSYLGLGVMGLSLIAAMWPVRKARPAPRTAV